ncbi:hypothetical protein SAMN05443579_102487 [Variovorax sp. PDC80]|nr:hypothetical protein SAMN05443579_102487 [Variovorax sp. PDC80]
MLALCLLPLAATAADGTIHFTGAIVGAPYEMRVDARPGALVHRVTGRTMEIRFLRQEIDPPSASVRVDTLGEQPLAIAFIDARGRTTQLAPSSERSIGQDGGVLSMAAQAAAVALVTVRYD